MIGDKGGRGQVQSSAIVVEESRGCGKWTTSAIAVGCNCNRGRLWWRTTVVEDSTFETGYKCAPLHVYVSARAFRGRAVVTLSQMPRPLAKPVPAGGRPQHSCNGSVRCYKCATRRQRAGRGLGKSKWNVRRLAVARSREVRGRIQRQACGAQQFQSACACGPKVAEPLNDHS